MRVKRRLSYKGKIIMCETTSLILREEHWLRVFEKRVLKKTFWSRREGIRGGLKKTEDIHGFYSSSNTIRVIKSKRMRWVQHVADIGNKIYMASVSKEVNGLHRNIDVDGTEILKWISQKRDWTTYTGLNSPGIDKSGGFQKMRETNWLAEKLLDSQERLCPS